MARAMCGFKLIEKAISRKLINVLGLELLKQDSPE